MKAMIVDDEPRACNILRIFLSERKDIDDVTVFSDAASALAYAAKNWVDVAFLDIEMPHINGIQLAMELLKLKHIPSVVFVTGYPQYALEAWNTDAVDYILKPYNAEEIAHAIEKTVLMQPKMPKETIEIQCFPTFHLILENESMVFPHKKSKELLAYLVHHRGAWVENNQAIAALFEDKSADLAKNYFRIVLYRLKQILIKNGIGDLIETHYGSCRIVLSRFTCDYYRYLDGETNSFGGEYLAEYSWAEPTVGILSQK